MSRFNVPFFLLRKDRNLTQQEMTELLGYKSRGVVHKVETGVNEGTLDFWRRVQKEFNIPDEQMWALQNGEMYEKK